MLRLVRWQWKSRHKGPVTWIWFTCGRPTYFEFRIRSKFTVLWFNMWSTDHNEGTRHDSVTVVTCAKFRCDRSNMWWTRALQMFTEFRIRLKYRSWDGRMTSAGFVGCTLCVGCLTVYQLSAAFEFANPLFSTYPIQFKCKPNIPCT